MDITIVLATYNRAPMLRKALESLVHQETGGKFCFDILVVDDGSPDQTPEVVQEVANFSGVAVSYAYQKNCGHCTALNAGIKRARGDWLAFFDDDQWAEPQWLAELYRAAQESRADCVGGAVYLDLPQSTLLNPSPRTRGLMGEKTLEQKIRDKSVKYYTGSGNALIRRALFSRVGGFDPIFRRGYDTDLFWRVEKVGFRLSYAPRAIAHHVIPASRLQPAYLRRLCVEQGVASARIRWQYQGRQGLIRSNFWRLGIALVRDLPLLAIASLARHRPLALDSLCSVWYTFNFMRSSLHFLAPRVFPQEKFFAAFGSPIPVGAHKAGGNNRPLRK